MVDKEKIRGFDTGERFTKTLYVGDQQRPCLTLHAYNNPPYF